MERDEEAQSGHEDLISPPVPADPRFDFSSQEDVSFEEFKTPTDRSLNSETSTTVHGRAPEGAEEAQDPLIGEVVGNYLILSLLGRGGFGSVYKARDAKLERYVAIKFLQYPRDAEFHRRFAREARVIANLSKHPNIVQIHSWGEHRGQSYFVLEHMDYSSDALLGRYPGGIPLVRALEIGRDCARALSHAHSNGVLHRDIKPGNILIDDATGQAKLCDFGLAFSHGPGDERSSTLVAGSPAYMSPEQFGGEKPDERSDIYSLGITLYRLLTGQLPYKGSSRADILSAFQKRSRVSLRSVRPDLSTNIAKIVERCIELDPSKRYQSVDALRVDLEDLLHSLVHSGTTLRMEVAARRRTPPVRLTLAVGVVALCVAIAVARPWTFIISAPASNRDPGLIEADELLRLGKTEDAVFVLSAELQENPSEDAAYLMAYASLFGGDVAGAAHRFGGLLSDALRAEGEIAVARWSKVEIDPARPSSASPTPYANVLLASIALEDGHAADALNQLGSTREEELKWTWQQQERRRLLDMARYRLGLLADASATPAGEGDDVASYYARVAGRQLDEERREEIRRQIANIRDAMERTRSERPTADDRWTSRPVRLRISPATAGGSRLAIETRFVYVLPAMLADALTEGASFPLEIVDREYIGDTLYEQELAELSSGSSQLRLGNLLGATHMVELEFERVFDQDHLRIKFIDTETTEVVQTKAISFDRTIRPQEWVDDVAAKALEALRNGFPIRARLAVDSGVPSINVGRNVGLTEDTEFRVFAGPALEREIERVSARSTDDITQSTARVELRGASVESVPEGGWYVQEVRE